MKTVLIESHFLPSLEFFCAILPCEKIILEKHEHFIKQSYRNRCFVLAANGVERLTVPVTEKHGKVLITRAKIDYGFRWQVNFWRTLESAYHNAPFFEHYCDDLKKEIFCHHTYLYDLNFRLLSLCLGWLKWEKSIAETVRYEKEILQPVQDMRGRISAKKDFLQREVYQPHTYQQVFGKAFVPNLSIIDLVFCEGPHAAAVLIASQKKLNK
ncbi:MAG TPA: WbqC family protein [Cyclobacteriaceae bacterium]|nr:WbqC family protein [Cyclobacteriaceae bacterium]